MVQSHLAITIHILSITGKIVSLWLVGIPRTCIDCFCWRLEEFSCFTCCIFLTLRWRSGANHVTAAANVVPDAGTMPAMLPGVPYSPEQMMWFQQIYAQQMAQYMQ